ncbi:unnamed protein product [Microthlaspi erraticum]|uniref:TF-B3 domain-containing protein n=1 Tax=Microthlaspi erraticum TaxID=1685480 RepID=A0A6D2I919_9BRAS|nr:unnamed protein product [Microthlaspi erraticum]
MPGALEHKVVFSVRWENEWLLWVQREKNGLFIDEENWNEFVDDNRLAPNDVLIFTHEETMYFQVQIIKNGEKELMEAPPEVEPETEPLHPKPQETKTATASTSASASANGGMSSRVSQGCGNVKSHEQYLLNPKNAYFVKTVGKKNDVLYVRQPVIKEYGLKFGPVDSAINYHLPNGTEETALNKVYTGYPCFTGWGAICRTHKLQQGDTVVCELERSGDVVTAVRLHFVGK